MLPLRTRALLCVGLGLLCVASTLIISRSRWPNSRRTEYARAVGRYHAHKQTDKFFQRAAPGGVTRGSK